TALSAPAASALIELLRGPPDPADQVWLPQGPGLDDEPGLLSTARSKSPELLLPSACLAQLPPAPAARAEVTRRLPAPSPYQTGLLFIDRFKSPELLLLSDWLAQLPPALADRAEVSRRLLDTFAYQIGRTLAAAHATPLVAPEGGRWTLRRPRLTSAEAILTYPECAFDTGAAQPFSAVVEQAGLPLCRGLAAAWEQASHRLVADPAAARAA